jgi:hypothetical protein
MTARSLLAAVAAAVTALAAPAQGNIRENGPDKPLDAAARSKVIDGVLAELDKAYVFPEVAKRMAEAVRAKQAKGEYDSESSGRGFAERLTKDLQAVSKDGHLRVVFSADPLPTGPRAAPSKADQERFEAGMLRRGAGFRKVEHLGGGVGYLDLGGFGPPEAIGPTAAAAMSFLAHCDAVIVDMRNNGGGSPEGVILLCSYFFGEQTHLNSIFDRTTGQTRQFWTHPSLPGPKLANADVYVLTAKRTFSGAEEFAYNMQTQKRGTVVGETTGGGAHPTRGVRSGDHFLVLVPFARSINPVTNTNWEGTGVKPDVAVPEGQALLTAQRLALQKGLTKHAADPQAAGDLKRRLEQVEAELAKQAAAK